MVCEFTKKWGNINYCTKTSVIYKDRECEYFGKEISVKTPYDKVVTIYKCQILAGDLEKKIKPTEKEWIENHNKHDNRDVLHK